MNKIVFIIFLLISSASLSACNDKSQAVSSTEEKIIDENLKLKEQIVELQMEKDEREKRDKIESEVQRELLLFINAVSLGNIDAAKTMVKDHIEVAPRYMALANGSEIHFQNTASYMVLFPETEWNGADSMCMSVEILKTEGISNLKVYLVKDEDSWKIDDIGI